MSNSHNSLLPQQRLALSRERMRVALCTAPSPPGNAPTGGLPWLEALKSEPAARLLLEALNQWWQQYPLRTVGGMVVQIIQTTLTPIAQRHPLGLVLAAFVAGGVLVVSKPWRWIPLPSLLAGVVPHLVLKWVTQVPLQTWMDRLDALVRQATKPKE